MVTTTLKFVETARLDGKLSVKAMNALQGPCLAFESDVFVAASAELQFENCHNIAQRLQTKITPDDYIRYRHRHWVFDLIALDANGGAMNVRGSLMVMGTLIIRDCRTKEGSGGSLGSNYGSLSPGIDDKPQKVDLWVRYVEL